MKYKKLRKIYRILFPKKFSQEELFELKLHNNELVKGFVKHQSIYEIELYDNQKVFIRDYQSSDYDVFQQIFNQQEYASILSFFKLNDEMKKPIIIIDAGANVGFTSVYFSKHLTNPLLFCIEPSFENFTLCSQNCALTMNSQNTKVYNKALCHQPNLSFSIERDFRDKKDWSITTKQDSNGEIQGITIGEIIKENNLPHVSLLKIDIEGAEQFLFKPENDLSFLKLTQIIAIEIHDEFNIRQTILEILKSNDFYLFESGELTIGVNKTYF